MVLSNHLQNICFVVVVVSLGCCCKIVIFLLRTFERQHNAGSSNAMDDVMALNRKCTWGANKSQIPSATFWYEGSTTLQCFSVLCLCSKGIGLIGSLLAWKSKEWLDNELTNWIHDDYKRLHYTTVSFARKEQIYFPPTLFTPKFVIFAKWHSRTMNVYKLGITVVHIHYNV